ncbi:formate dehydrogenase accessory sulfurtransferase FdhD [Noviherbaspirillum sedimenti]|uniref:Sulfur carrier protein FdhD n=2 Tax=Noviherbaspirillum sedimenti TaxID=2320865 RepID=A0A3A3G4M5_9BURK|nr:formate dehydrogenase accessory sulfurtransferase FdhD [Noviherbaspirillum sedimenti]
MLAEAAMKWVTDPQSLPPTSRHDVARLAVCDRRQSHDDLAEEVPVALEYNGIAHAVMLATPCDLEEFALGFSLTEGILQSKRELYDIEIRHSSAGITVSMTVSSGAFMAMKAKRRNLAGRTGCGLCGTEQLDQVLRPVPAMAWDRPLQASAIRQALHGLGAHQPIARLTGATHAAAWCSAEGRILAVFEDVGRHNALDKLAGAMAMTGMDTDFGFALITSRASVEMVQKAATVRIPALVAISAPTALAVRTAQQCGLTLVAFARGDNFVAYTNANTIESD